MGVGLGGGCVEEQPLGAAQSTACDHGDDRGHEEDGERPGQLAAVTGDDAATMPSSLFLRLNIVWSKATARMLSWAPELRRRTSA